MGGGYPLGRGKCAKSRSSLIAYAALQRRPAPCLFRLAASQGDAPSTWYSVAKAFDNRAHGTVDVFF